MPSFDELLACPRCGGGLRRLRCGPCSAQYAAPDGIPDLRVSSDARTERVREFYARAPFPGYPDRDSLSSLRARASRSDFARRLDEAIPGDALVLELGCGTGQLSLFLASAERTVVGADLARPSLALARAAAARYGVNGVHFVETDLRAPGLRPGAFDVVICSGVLHHTPEPRTSFASVARLARSGGVLVIGLSNAYARLPLRLRRAVARLPRYRWIPWAPTLREVQGWFRENGVEYLRAFPSALLAGESDHLFEQAEDDWPFEGLLAQLSWMRALGGEGGLFVAVGSK